MRVIAILARHIRHRPRARHLHPARPEQRPIVNMRRPRVDELREQLPVDLHPHAIRQLLYIHAREGAGSEDGGGEEASEGIHRESVWVNREPDGVAFVGRVVKTSCAPSASTLMVIHA